MNPHQRCLQAKVKYRNEPKTGNAKEWRPKYPASIPTSGQRWANVCHYVGPTSFCPSAQRSPKITSVKHVMQLVCELAH